MMITASIFSCTNDYDPGLIENSGMKEQPLRIITKTHSAPTGQVPDTKPADPTPTNK